MQDLEHTIRDHGTFVRRLAHQLVFGGDQAADVEQQTWLAALDHPPARQGIRAWLATVARNFARRARRTEVRRVARELAAARPEAVPSAADLVERQAALRQVVDAVLALDEPYRSTVLLHYYENLDAAEIATAQGVPAATVRTRLKRGLDRLRERLDAGHDGDRRRWMSALLPASLGALKPVAAAAAAATAAGTTAATLASGSATVHGVALGGLIVAKKLALTAAIALLVVVSVYVMKRTGEPSTPETVHVPVGATVGEAPPTGSPPAGAAAAIIPAGTSKVVPTPFQAGADELASASTAGRLRVKVSGRVVDESGRPLADVPVHATLTATDGNDTLSIETADTADSARQVRTAADGRFTLNAIPLNVAVMVLARPVQLCDVTRETEITKPADVDLGDLVAAIGGSVAGVVTNVTGTPIKGATVTARGDEKSTGGGPGMLVFGPGLRGGDDRAATTDAGGRYRIDGIPAGECRVVARSEECPGMRKTGVRVARNEVTWEVDFKLLVGRTIEGTVRTAEGTPVAGAHIGANAANLHFGNGDVPPETRREATTGPDGRFAVHGLRDELYNVRARVAGYLPGDSMNVAAGTADLVVVLRPSGVIWGVVRDSVTDQPLADADVQFGVQQFGRVPSSSRRILRGAEAAALVGVPDQPGLFAVADAPESALSLTIGAPRHAKTIVETRGASGAKIEVQPRLEPECAVSGTVVDAAGQPLAGAHVAVTPRSETIQNDVNSGRVRSVRRVARAAPSGGAMTLLDEPSPGGAESGPDGSFRIGGLARGEFEVTATHPAFAPAEKKSVTLVPGTPVDGLQLAMRPAGRLAGRAFDADGKPAAGARVSVRTALKGAGNAAEEVDFDRFGSRSALADAEGNYEVNGLEAGSYLARLADGQPSGGVMVFMSAGQAAPGKDEVAVAIEAGKTTRQDLTMSPRSSLSGVVREAGKPVAGMKVSLGQADAPMFFGDQGPSATTDDHGAFTIQGVTPGDYLATVDPPGAPEPIRQPVTLEPRREATVEINLPTGVIEGVVTDKATRKPIAGVEVKATAKKPGGEATKTVTGVMIAMTADNDGPASITVSGPGQKLLTDAAGHFTLRYLLPAEYVVSIEGAGVIAMDKTDVKAKEGQVTTGVDFAAERGATAIIVVDAAGLDAPMLLAMLTSPDDPDDHRPASGTLKDPCKFTGLKPGHYTVKVHVPTRDDVSGEATFEVTSGAEQRVPVRLRQER